MDNDKIKLVSKSSQKCGTYAPGHECKFPKDLWCTGKLTTPSTGSYRSNNAQVQYCGDSGPVDCTGCANRWMADVGTP